MTIPAQHTEALPALLPWTNTAGLAQAIRLHTTPGSAPDTDSRRRLASIIGAYHASVGSGSGIMFGWLRPTAGGPVTILTTTTAPIPDGTDLAGLTYPPGAAGRPLPGDRALELVQALPVWTRIAIIADGLTADIQNEPTPQGLEDLLLDVWPDAFGWLLLAVPLAAADVDAEAVRTGDLEAEARKRTSPKYTVQAQRLEARHRELRTGESTGLWQVHLLAGGPDRAGAHTVAGLLAAGIDLSAQPYTLVPARHDGDFTTAWATTTGDTAASPQVCSSPMLAALALPPRTEIPGIMVTQPHTFDVTADTRPGITIGRVLDRSLRPGQPVTLSAGSLNRHMFVTGATGSGKSHTIRHLLGQASRAGIPWLVVEAAKSEYHTLTADLADTGAELVVIRPGDPDTTPLLLNPLQPADGFPLQTHADLIRALFTAAFDAAEPFPQILSAALTAAYARAGWDLRLSQPTHPGVTPAWPTLTDLEHTAHAIIDDAGYGAEVRAFTDRGSVFRHVGSRCYTRLCRVRAASVTGPRAAAADRSGSLSGADGDGRATATPLGARSS